MLLSRVLIEAPCFQTLGEEEHPGRENIWRILLYLLHGKQEVRQRGAESLDQDNPRTFPW